MKHLLAHTIWGKQPDVTEWKYRNFKRVFLPSFDGIMFSSGVAAVLYGIPTLDFFFDPWFVKSFAVIFMIASVLCLTGNIFPARWKSEIVGVTLKMGLAVIYWLALIVRTFTGDPSKLFGVFFVAGIIGIIIFRLSIVGAEWQDRRRFIQ